MPPRSLSINEPREWRERVLRLRPRNPLRDDDDLRTSRSLLTDPPMQNRIVERKKHATAAQVNPYAYFPILADWPALLKWLRPRTLQALLGLWALAIWLFAKEKGKK
jgi:hypothetical protein